MYPTEIIPENMLGSHNVVFHPSKGTSAWFIKPRHAKRLLVRVRAFLHLSRAEWNADFACYDIGKDGYINAKEFEAMAHAGVGFDALDRDGDAHVSHEEYNAAFDQVNATSVLKVLEVHRDSGEWSMETSGQQCAFTAAGKEAEDQGDEFRFCNHTLDEEHKLCILSWSAGESLRKQGTCARVNFAHVHYQLQQKRVVDAKGALVHVEVRQSMLPSSTEVAALVVFASERPTWWRIELSLHGYEAGAVCGVGEYGVSDGPPGSVGLKGTIPPFETLPLPNNSFVRSTVRGNNKTYSDTYSNSTHNATRPLVCRTIGGTAPEGSACVFPFVHSGTTHYTCTTENNKGVPWCSTSQSGATAATSGNRNLLCN